MTLTVERLASSLQKQFADLIDLSDLKPTLPEQDKKDRFLSRAQAAFVLTILTQADAQTASGAVCDQFGDGGIDAIYYDGSEKTLYIVQSKWSRNGTKTIDDGSCQKFLKGIEKLIQGDFAYFNQRIQKREGELKAFLERSDVNIALVVVYNSSNPLADPVKESLKDFLGKQNNVGDAEVFSLEVKNLETLYSFLSGSGVSNKIKMQVALNNWGTVESPYRAYYGSALVSDIENWAQHGKTLLDRNLRFYRGSTEINSAIEETLSREPEHFWYFNNGITILCSKLEKTRLYGDSRDHGVFDCEGVSIVNGGQTVSVIWETAKRPRSVPPDARVHVRLISLEKCPATFGPSVTRSTNTQNPIQNRDFAALDGNQQRLAREMEMDGRKYAFKSGDYEPKSDEGCNIEDATIALACATKDVSLAVQAKREIGQLWRDIKRPPYTTLFNDSLQATEMWRAVRILRAVSAELESIDKKPHARGELVAVHGNRFILHMVFQDPEVQRYRDPNVPIDSILEAARNSTRLTFGALASRIQSKHSDSYLANLFKNAQKCKTLAEEMRDNSSPLQTRLAFGPVTAPSSSTEES